MKSTYTAVVGGGQYRLTDVWWQWRGRIYRLRTK